MATGIITISDTVISPREIASHAAKLKSIVLAEPEIWVSGHMHDGKDIAFLTNAKQVLSIRRGKIQIEVDGELGWYTPLRLTKVVFVIK